MTRNRTNYLSMMSPTWLATIALVSIPACDDGEGLEDTGSTGDAPIVQPEPISHRSTTAEAGSALADAYDFFKADFEHQLLRFDRRFPMGAGHHPGLVNHPASALGLHASAKVIIDFDQNKVEAKLHSIPMDEQFDLWFVKNIPGAGKTVAPEVGDQSEWIGTFNVDNVSEGSKSLVATNVNVLFDLDMVVVTRAGMRPEDSRVAVGSRTLFEKWYFRDRDAGGQRDPVTGPQFDGIETNDPLVRRGAELFFNETFDGNGRTCGTCHRAENNLSIDAEFIAGLPEDDPLFVFKTNPALAGLEVEGPLRNQGLILVNAEGFDRPTENFVLRSVNHTLSVGTTLDPVLSKLNEFPLGPPQQRLGWGGDGAPGRGTLHEFAFGAIIQHAPQRLDRVPGIDFRIPTQAELDALEAFQLFTGRASIPRIDDIVFTNPEAELGKALSTPSGPGRCGFCHRDMPGGVANINDNFETGVNDLNTLLPYDDGFRTAPTSSLPGNPLGANKLGTEHFNPPPVIEAADSAPFFHNNKSDSIESAIRFYNDEPFASSTGAQQSGAVNLTPEEIDTIGVFLRELNAADNLRQVRRRLEFVRDNRSPGNDQILKVALADLNDAIRVLEERSLNADARHSLVTMRQIVEFAAANDDSARVPFMIHALAFATTAKAALISDDPNGDF